MQRALTLAFATLVCAAGTSAVAHAHAAPPQGSHLIIVKMVDKDGGFAFVPSAITAQRGDTVRFLQSSSAPHNVSFRKQPHGAKLGAAAVGPYVMENGQSYDLVIDTRFVDGNYTFACDPHESVGMTGTLVVGKPAP